MNQSGITLSQEIRDFFHDARQDGKVRWFKLTFNNEQLEISKHQSVAGDEAADFNSLQGAVEAATPAYIVFKLDSKDSGKNEYILILYVPDGSKVKTKMLMSSTAETIKNNLGYNYFVGTYHCTKAQELTYAEFRATWSPKADAHKFHDLVRTEKEKQQLEEKAMQHDIAPSKSNIKGLAFPLDDAGRDALTKYASKQYKFVVLKIENETLQLDVAAEEAAVDEIVQQLSPNEPRFCFYIYSHEYQDNVIDSTFFIYSCPQTKVKQRMIYSASKSSVQSLLGEFGVTNFDKTMEISDLKDLTESYLFDMIHGQAAVLASKDSFAKPKRPTAGARRPAKK